MFDVFRKAALGSLFVCLLACAPLPSAPQITLEAAWIRTPPNGRDVTAGYILIKNQGGKDQLLSASSPLIEDIEIHEHIEEDGMMQMREVDILPIPENGQVVFRPGGYHLMMFGVPDVKKGQKIELVLHFKVAGPKSILALVGKPTAAKQ